MQLQPPSGGCVLKLLYHRSYTSRAVAAAFGRLCVETWRKENFSHLNRLRLQAVLRCNKT